MGSFNIFPGVKIEDASATLKYFRAAGSVNSTTTYVINANAVIQPVPGGTMVPLTIAANISPEKNEVVLEASTSTMINNVIPGVDFFSAGAFGLKLKIANGKIGSPVLTGTVCLGDAEDCVEGKPNEKNVVGRYAPTPAFVPCTSWSQIHSQKWTCVAMTG